MGEPKIYHMGWDMDDGQSGQHWRTSNQQLRLTITQNIASDHTECTIRIPRTLDVEAGPVPRHAFLSSSWIMLQDDGISEYTMRECGYQELAPEGLAMKFLRLAWLAAHDEKHPRG